MVTRSGEVYCPDRGDFIQLDLTPSKEHEQAGKRPALVVSPKSYNHKVGLCVVFPITSARKGYPFEVDIPQGLAVYGVVLSDQCSNKAWRERGAKFLGAAPHALLDEVLAKFKTLLS